MNMRTKNNWIRVDEASDTICLFGKTKKFTKSVDLYPKNIQITTIVTESNATVGGGGTGAMAPHKYGQKYYVLKFE